MIICIRIDPKYCSQGESRFDSQCLLTAMDEAFAEIADLYPGCRTPDDLDDVPNKEIQDDLQDDLEDDLKGKDVDEVTMNEMVMTVTPLPTPPTARQNMEDMVEPTPWNKDVNDKTLKALRYRERLVEALRFGTKKI